MTLLDTCRTPIPKTTRGRVIDCFPLLTELTNGMRGIWVLGGDTGIGKTWLAIQLAAGVAGPDFPVFYVDAENDMTAGKKARAVGDRLIAAYGREAAEKALEHMDAGWTIEEMKRRMKPPGLIVLDYLQAFTDTTRDTSRVHTSTEALLQEARLWVRAGFTVLLVSDENPDGSYKYSKGIKRAAWLAMRAIERQEGRLDIEFQKARDVDPSIKKKRLRLRLVSVPCDDEIVSVNTKAGVRVEEINVVDKHGDAKNGAADIPKHLRPLLRFVQKKGGGITRGQAVAYFKSKTTRTVENWLTEAKKRLLDADGAGSYWLKAPEDAQERAA